MKRIVIPVVLFICLALGGLLVVRSRVQQPQLEQGGPVDPDSLIKLNDDGPAPVSIAAPSDSILFFGNDMGAVRLATDMQSGVIPTMCTALYDEEGARETVVVTDPEAIAELYARLAFMTVGEPSLLSATDAYHSIAFTLQDGTVVEWHFASEELLCRDEGNYEVNDRADLWGKVRELQ